MKHIIFYKHLVLCSFLLSSILACSSNSGSSSSSGKLTLDLKSFASAAARNQKSSAVIVQHISIDISGSNMPDVLWEWDNNGGQAAPGNVDLMVPQGTGRLVQVIMAVSVPSTTSGTGTGTSSGKGGGGGSLFMYGQGNLDVVGAIATAAITVNSVGTSTSSGTIEGRYMSTATSGPTGRLSMYYVPGPGKRDMLVHQSEIFNGWFKAFALIGAQFKYVGDDGTVLFGAGVSADSASLISSTNKAQSARVFVPANFQNYCGSTPCYYPNERAIATVGFFGPGVPKGAELCYKTTSSPIPFTFTGADGGTPITWAGALAPSGASQAGVLAGGATAAQCAVTTGSGSTAYVDRLTLDETQISGGDSMLGFYGPFLNLATAGTGYGSEYVQSGNYDASKGLPINWKFNSSAAQGIDGVDIFYKVDTGNSSGNSGDQYRSGDGIACGRLESDFGFTKLGRYTTSDATAYIDPNHVSASDIDYVQLFVCPFKSGGLISKLTGKSDFYFGAAAQLYSGGSGGPGAPTYNLKIVPYLTGAAANTFAATYNSENVGYCKAYAIQFNDDTGAPALAPSDIVVTFTTDNSNVALYPSPACSPAALSTVTITAGTSGAVFYAKGLVAGLTRIGATGMLDGSPLPYGLGGANGFTAIVAGGSTAVGLAVGFQGDGSNVMLVGGCYPITYSLYDATGASAYLNTASTANMYSFVASFTGGAGEWHSLPDCSDSALSTTAFAYPAQSAQVIYFFKPTSASTAAGSLNISGSAGGLPSTITNTNASNIWIDDPTTPDHLAVQFFTGGNMSVINGLLWSTPADCIEVAVEAMSAHQSALDNDVAYFDTSATVTAANGSFYSDPSCTALVGSTINLTQSTLGNNTFYKYTVPYETFSFGSVSVKDVSGAVVMASSANSSQYFYPVSMDVQVTSTSPAMAHAIGVAVFFRDFLGGPYLSPGVFNVNVQRPAGITAGTWGLTPSSSTCTSPTASSLIPSLANQSFVTTFLCAGTTLSGTASPITASIPGNSLMPVAMSSNIATGGSAVSGMHWTASAPGGGVGLNGVTLQHNRCEPALFWPTDSNGQISTSVTMSSTSATLSGGSVYSAMTNATTCSGTLNASSLPAAGYVTGYLQSGAALTSAALSFGSSGTYTATSTQVLSISNH